VLCDTDVLATLPPAEYRSGLGEMAKYHFLEASPRPRPAPESRSGRRPDLRASGAGSASFADLPLVEKVARCVAIKARFVEADEREEVFAWTGGEAPTRPRAILNYGHTLAHALETAGHYDLRHGEAVAIGLVFAARLARRLGRIDDRRVDEHVGVVDGYGLPTSVPAGADPGELIDLMARDKKAVDGLTFVLDGPRGLEVVRGIERADVEAALAETPP
ncbi:MAG TPA: hypothetical protein VE760_06120, partial [Acidimicrobiales bacterium]|nr:hypothetical protein [Acidimicrobiales bacterium]